MSVRNANIVSDGEASDMIGRALTKIFIHSPLVLFEPLSKITSGKNRENTRLNRGCVNYTN